MLPPGGPRRPPRPALSGLAEARAHGVSAPPAGGRGAALGEPAHREGVGARHRRRRHDGGGQRLRGADGERPGPLSPPSSPPAEPCPLWVCASRRPGGQRPHVARSPLQLGLAQSSAQGPRCFPVPPDTKTDTLHISSHNFSRMSEQCSKIELWKFRVGRYPTFSPCRGPCYNLPAVFGHLISYILSVMESCVAFILSASFY